MNLPGIIALGLGFIAALLLLALGGARRFAGLIILIIVAGIGAFFGSRAYRYETQYPQIDIGTSEARVFALLGSPKRITNCGTIFGSPRGKAYPPVAGCVQEYWYHSFYFPEAWQYGFDKDRKLIYKYHWISY